MFVVVVDALLLRNMNGTVSKQSGGSAVKQMVCADDRQIGLSKYHGTYVRRLGIIENENHQDLVVHRT